MVELHFVFSPHIDNISANALDRVLKKIKGSGRRVSFVGIELAEEKASERVKNEKYFNSFLSPGNHERNVQKIVIGKYKIPLKLIEAIRPMQLKKMKRLYEKSSKHYASVELFGFQQAINYCKNAFYSEIAAHASRHDEVVRNLKREIKDLGENDVGVVLFGTTHLGLDEYVGKQLGVKTKVHNYLELTSKQKLLNALFKKEQPVNDEYFGIREELIHKGNADPKIKLTDAEVARIAVSMLFLEHLSHDSDISKINQIRKFINRLSYKQIQEKWDEIRVQPLAGLNNYMEDERESEDKHTEIHDFLKKTFKK